jgi:hypothetical protein
MNLDICGRQIGFSEFRTEPGAPLQPTSKIFDSLRRDVLYRRNDCGVTEQAPKSELRLIVSN